MVHCYRRVAECKIDMGKRKGEILSICSQQRWSQEGGKSSQKSGRFDRKKIVQEEGVHPGYGKGCETSKSDRSATAPRRDVNPYEAKEMIEHLPPVGERRYERGRHMSVYVNDTHPATNIKDGNMRWRINESDEIWSVFPQHVLKKDIEDAFQDCALMSIAPLCFQGQELNDIHYLQVPGRYAPCRGWMSFQTREHARVNDFLTHDHLSLMLAMLTRNDDITFTAIVPWYLTTRAKACASIYSKWIKTGK